jgi:hypothetical protein
MEITTINLRAVEVFVGREDNKGRLIEWRARPWNAELWAGSIYVCASFDKRSCKRAVRRVICLSVGIAIGIALSLDTGIAQNLRSALMWPSFY